MPRGSREERDGARLMRRLEPGASPIPPPPDVAGADLDEYVPAPLRAHLAVSSGEAEHRQVTVAFVKVSGTDELIAARRARAPCSNGSTRSPPRSAAPARRTASRGSSRTSTSARSSSTSPAARRRAPGDDEEGMLRALREIVAADIGLPLRAGVNRGHVFTGDIGGATRRTYAVMGDAVNLAARLTARAQPGDILATADVLDRATDDLRDREGAAPRQGQGARRDGAPRRRADRLRATAPRSTRRPSSAATTSSTLCAPPSTPRGCGSCRSSSSSASPGSASRASSRELRTLALGFQQLDARRRAVRVVDAVLRVAEPAAPARGDHAGPLARGGRRAARAVGRRRDARPRALAAAARDPVRRRGAVDARGRRPRPGREPRPAARDRRDVPRARADDADAARRRGRALARRRVALPAPPSHREAGAAALARLRDDAARRGADRRHGRPGERIELRAARRRRTRRRSRSSVAEELALLERDGDGAGRALGRQPALRARARLRGAPRRARRRRCPSPSRACSRPGSTRSSRPTGCCSATRR